MKSKLQMILVTLILSLILGGCNTKTVTDSQTVAELSPIQSVDGKITHTVLHDGMERSRAEGRKDYFNKTIAIDPSYYNNQSISRGDVVYFYNREKGENDIARVVALPGEDFKIEKGQVFIDDMILDTFYGKEHNYGELVERSDFTFEELTVQENHYYLMADNWWRWGILKGAIPKDDIKGKVVGYLEE
jgi:signal peptidase I